VGDSIRPAEPGRLPVGSLKKRYTAKRLVDVDGESLFGELAIVRWLSKDGWSALWVDTLHGRKFRRAMPGTEPVEPPNHVRKCYKEISAKSVGAGGCFDVVAWKGKWRGVLRRCAPSPTRCAATGAATRTKARCGT
jgi:hypothetical protein